MTDEPNGTTQTEGYTMEQTDASELGQPGTPGSGMSADAPHAADQDLIEHGAAPADPIIAGHSAPAHDEQAPGLHDEHGHDEHGHDEHGHDEHGHAAHGHEESNLGPIDWGKWAYAIAGAVSGLIVLGFFLFALGGIPA